MTQQRLEGLNQSINDLTKASIALPIYHQVASPPSANTSSNLQVYHPIF